MAGPTVLCPCCGKRLVCSFPPEAGQSMRCHGCGRPFTVPGKKAAAKAAPAARRYPVAAMVACLLAAILCLAGLFLATAYFGQGPSTVAAEVAPLAEVPAKGEAAKADSAPPDIPRPNQAAPEINIELVPPAPMPDEAKPEAVADMPAMPEPAPLPRDGLIKDWLPKKEQAIVDEAVRRGVVFLKKSQLPDGSWAGGGHSVGATAISALALLECGVPANDVSIRRAAGNLRKQVPALNRTYETSLCILFFDRLRAPEDRGRIVTLSLRLLAGQQEDGGWSYTCPFLNRTDESNLLIALRLSRPQSSEELFTRTSGSLLMELYLPKETTSKTLKMTLEEQNPTPASGTIEIALAGVTTKPEPGADQAKARAEPDEAPPPPERPEKDDPPARPENRVALGADARPAIDKLPQHLRRIPALPAVAALTVAGQKRVMEMRGRVKHSRTDNSNTQFAIIGLWAARRHQVPMDRALALIVGRFHSSQNLDGSWQYHHVTPRGAGRGRATMTGAALIGLGVGYGLTLPNGAAREKGVPANPQLTDGLKSLGDSLENGERRGGPRFKRGGDLYYWWTVERVAVLYGLRSFQGRPWYEAGVADIVPAQERDGSWTYEMGGAGQPVGTSFALLFLKGSNLVSDLSQTIKGDVVN